MRVKRGDNLTAILGGSYLRENIGWRCWSMKKLTDRKRLAMKQPLLMFCALLLAMSPVLPAIAQNEVKDQPEPSERNRQLEENGQLELEKGCACCKACMEARKEIQGKEEGPPAKDGCRDCCRRCGHIEVPDKRKMPPEIVK